MRVMNKFQFFKSIKNFSNKFVEEELFKEVLEQCKKIKNNKEKHVFGIEYNFNNKDVLSNVVLPSIILLEGSTFSHNRLQGDYTIWEGKLSQELYKPLKKTENIQFKDALKNEVMKNLSHDSNSIFYLQFLFSFLPIRDIQRQECALQSYEKYLLDNELTISEAEEKIIDEVLIFQIRLATPHSNSIPHNDIASAVQRALSIFDYYNGIKLYRNIINGMSLDSYNNRTIGASNSMQFISLKEIYSMFDLSLDSEEQNHLNHSTFEIKSKKNNNTHNPKHNLLSLLPLGDNEDYLVYDNEPTQIVNSIADALKRVGLINQARIHNSEVVTGARLITIQFDIPKGKNITQLQKRTKDIQAALGVNSLGIEQGSKADTVRFTIPNENSTIVTLGDLMEKQEYREFVNEESNKLPFVAGVDEVNNPIYLSLAKLVHLMVAGTTGSGKSAFINSLSLSLILHHTPKELKMIMVDPKRVELSNFKNFPHVDAVITDMRRAERILRELVGEMEARYSLLEKNNVKNINIFNKKVSEEEKMPYIVCIIDEYADLKDMFPDVEEHIARLGQKARAAGIHLVLTTQRPDVKIISGRVKAVIPNAISFNLNNSNNYRTVFGTSIPYSSLMGKGDGVMKIEGHPKEFQRFQSAIVTPHEETEDELFDSLTADYSEGTHANDWMQDENILPIVDSNLMELKKIIATTKETKIAPLRTELGVKTETVSKLMNKLVEEGWLLKHNSKSKGYEIIASNEELDKYR